MQVLLRGLRSAVSTRFCTNGGAECNHDNRAGSGAGEDHSSGWPHSVCSGWLLMRYTAFSRN